MAKKKKVTKQVTKQVAKKPLRKQIGKSTTGSASVKGLSKNAIVSKKKTARSKTIATHSDRVLTTQSMPSDNLLAKSKTHTTNRKLTWIPDRSDIRDHMFMAAPITMPPQLSLQNHCTPIKDQGQLGACTAFGIVGNVEMLNPSVTYAELFLYYNERKLEGTVKQDAGAEIRDGIKVAAKAGICKDATWPYNIKKYRTKPSAAAVTEGLKFQITEYLRVEGLVNIKNCIAQGFPVIFGTTWYDVYDSAEVESTGMMPILDRNVKDEGGHCMLIVGYDDVNQRLTVRNSWGTSWGAQGYCYFPYSTVSQFDDMWTIRGEERG